MSRFFENTGAMSKLSTKEGTNMRPLSTFTKRKSSLFKQVLSDIKFTQVLDPVIVKLWGLLKNNLLKN